MRNNAVLFSAAALLGGCVTGDLSADLDSDRELLPEGTEGHDRVRRRGQDFDLAWVVQDGRKYVEDDFDIGPAYAGEARSALSLTLDPWANNIVPYCVMPPGQADGSGLGTADLFMIDRGLKELERIGPLDFKWYPCDASDLPARFVDFRHRITEGNARTTRAENHEGVTIEFPTTFSERTVWHEMGHATGFMHEHRRFDRDLYVNFYSDCLENPESTQFKISEDVTTDRLSPYDITSVMHYESKSGSKQYPECPTLLRKDGSDYPYGSPDLEGSVIHRSPEVSDEDINAMFQVYEPELGRCDHNDQFGTRVAAGDFDGDGYTDLAVGAPGEAVGSSVASGAVMLYKGTWNGLTAWRRLEEKDFASAAPRTADRFGDAFGVGDIDGDGDDDLLIGAPFYGSTHGGAVFTYLGGRGGPVPWAGGILTQSNTGAGTSQSGEMFGAAIAIGAFDGGTSKYIAIGAPYETQSGTGARGVVSLFRAGRTSVTHWNNLWATRPHDGDMFGYALAVANFNGGGDDLLVGAPQIGTGSGFVTPFFGGASGMTVGSPLPRTTPASGDRFGYSLATGRASSGAAVAVGAPGRVNGAGRVYRYETQTTTFGQPAELKQSDISGQTSQPSDGFGTAIAMGDIDGGVNDDIIVGIPNKTKNGVAGAGQVDIFHANGTGFVLSTNSLQAQDSFGSTIAIGNFNRGAKSVVGDANMDLAIGLPGRTCGGQSGAGVVNTYDGFAFGFWRQLNQEITGGP